MQAEVIIGHLLSACNRGTAPDEGSSIQLRTSMAHAAMELGVLTTSQQHGRGAEVVSELLSKTSGMLNSKQASSKRQGLELLAIQLAECDRRTFLSSHLDWFGAVLSVLRSEQAAAAASTAAAKGEGRGDGGVAAAAWACLTALFSRLHRMLDIPGVRRDGATMVPKLLALLQQRYPQQAEQGKGSRTAAAGEASASSTGIIGEPQAMQTLLAAVTALPAPFRQHLPFLDQMLCRALMTPAMPAGTARLAAACVASLPRINGDGSSWSGMTQRLLTTSHALLDTLFLSMDDPGLLRTARELLDPHASPLPGCPDPSSATLPAYKAAFSQLDAVLEALQALLTRSYPSAVPLPSMGILLLVSRVLAVDDASGAGKAGGSKFAELVLRLPALHAAALRLLRTLLRAGGGQLAPLFLATGRMLGEYLGREAAGGAGALAPVAPVVRCQLYSAVQQLLQSAGVGVVRTLAQSILQCARAELYGSLMPGGGGREGADGGAPSPPAKKKARKSKGGAGGGEDALGTHPNDNAGALAARRVLEPPAAMLGVLEALLSNGAALLAPGDRELVYAMAAHMASTTTAAVQKLGQDADGDTSPLLPLQLAAYRSLLAAVLAPEGHRSLYLPLALRLFRGGLRGGSAALAALCAQALLCCEALMHPRSAPRSAPSYTAPAAAGHSFGTGGSFSAASNGEDDPRSISLGKPAFWSYLDAAAELAAEAGAVAAAGAAEAERPQQYAAATGGAPLDPSPQQAQQQEQADTIMTEAPAQHRQSMLLPAQPTPAALAPASAAPAVLSAAAPAQQQQLSSMAAVLAGGGSAPVHATAPGPARAVGPMPASGQLLLAVPSAAAAAAQQTEQGAGMQPAALGPSEAGTGSNLQQALARGVAATVPEPEAALEAPAQRLRAFVGDEDEDSDGPLPDIDSGEEGSSSEDDVEDVDG